MTKHQARAAFEQARDALKTVVTCPVLKLRFTCVATECRRSLRKVNKTLKGAALKEDA